MTLLTESQGCHYEGIHVYQNSRTIYNIGETDHGLKGQKDGFLSLEQKRGALTPVALSAILPPCLKCRMSCGSLALSALRMYLHGDCSQGSCDSATGLDLAPCHDVVLSQRGIHRKGRSAFPGLVNFDPADAYHFCLNLSAAFSQPGIGLTIC